MRGVLWAWEVDDELGWAGVAFGMLSGLGSRRWIGICRGGLRDGIGGMGSGR